MKRNRHHLAATVSGTVSARSRKAVANSGQLARIILEFPCIFAIFPLLNRLLQVAARPDPPIFPTAFFSVRFECFAVKLKLK